MFRRGFFFRALGAILFLVLLTFGGFAIHRAGMAQGYALGVAASVEEGTLPEGVPNQIHPMLYRGYGWYGYGPGFHPFGGLGFIFPLFFGLLFFFLFMRLIFRPWGWGGPHAYWKHYGPPPWAKDWEKGETKSDEKPDVKPESE